MPPKWPIADGCAISATLQVFYLLNSASFQHGNIRRHELILMELWMRVANNARAKRCTQVRMDAYRRDALFDPKPWVFTVDTIRFVSEMPTCKFYSSQMD